MFNSPEHRGDDGHRAAAPPRDRRAARGRCCRTPARSCRSRSCMAIITAAVPKDVLLKIFSGVASGLRSPAAWTRSSTTCTPRSGCSPRRPWSALSCRCCVPPTSRAEAEAEPDGGGGPLRIGEVARAVGTTPRTIRYYEEIGLLGRRWRARGRQAPHLHRAGRRAPARRAAAKELLGVSLEELHELLEAEEARAALRDEWRQRRSRPGAPRARSSRRRAATSTASSSWSGAGERRSSSSKPSWPSAARACASCWPSRASPPSRPAAPRSSRHTVRAPRLRPSRNSINEPTSAMLARCTRRRRTSRRCRSCSTAAMRTPARTCCASTRRSGG